MKKVLCLLTILTIFAAAPAIAAPPHHHAGGRPPMHAGVSMGHRPQMGHPPMGGMHRPPYHHHVGVRPLPPPPPLYRPYRPIVRPYYYSTVYYPSTTYTTYTYQPYEPVVPVSPTVNTVVVRDNYAGINTAANVINAAANVAATIRYLTW